MRDPIRVMVLGTGQMGAGIARLVLQKRGLQLVGAFARRAARGGLDLGPAIGLDRELGMAISADLLTLIRQGRPEVAIQATCSTLEEARGEIEALVRHGVHVISIAEEMAFPAATSATLAAQLHRLAVANRVALLGTGVNPGFVLDLLVILLSGVCAEVHAIAAERVNDLTPYGPTVLNTQGVGLTPAAFDAGLAAGTVRGHIGFAQSVHMIAQALDWTIERIEQNREPIISETRRETPFVTVEPGQAAGCRHTAIAYRAGKPVITLTHPQQVRPELADVATCDRIQISGTPDVALSGSPEIPGGRATAALSVNMIPRVLNAPPGLHCMADLPVPAALLGDARHRLHPEPVDG